MGGGGRGEGVESWFNAHAIAIAMIIIIVITVINDCGDDDVSNDSDCDTDYYHCCFYCHGY